MTDVDRTDEDVKELVERHWDGRAATFDDESQHGIHTPEQHERWLSTLRTWTGDDPCHVLDVGCGTGVVSVLLAELGHAVAGVDFAPGMLDRARGKAARAGYSIDFLRGDAEMLPVGDDAVELVTARHLVWTLPSPDSAIQEWRRVVEPGGRILLLEGYWDHDEPWEEYEVVHESLPMYHGRPADELGAFLADAGLQAVEYEPLMDPVLWGREPRHEYYAMAATVPA